MSDELIRVRDLKKIFSVPAGELHCSGARSLANRARSVSNITPA